MSPVQSYTAQVEASTTFVFCCLLVMRMKRQGPIGTRVWYLAINVIILHLLQGNTTIVCVYVLECMYTSVFMCMSARAQEKKNKDVRKSQVQFRQQQEHLYADYIKYSETDLIRPDRIYYPNK